MLPAPIKAPIDVAVLERVDVRVGRIESVSPAKTVWDRPSVTSRGRVREFR